MFSNGFGTGKARRPLGSTAGSGLRFGLVPVVVLLAVVVFALAAVPASAAIVTNGDFETGDLTGWTVFTTANGTANDGSPPTVSSFDTTGSGASNAAQFDVGQSPPSGNSQEGGGIYQTVNVPTPGYVVFRADVASSAANNYDCASFNLQVDGFNVSATGFGACDPTAPRRGQLGATLKLASGGHELRVLITRGYGAGAGTPNEYVDNITATRTTELSCTPSSVSVGAATTCTATESALFAPPTGTVTFATDSGGGFSPGGCTLVTSSAHAASCSVSYTPSQVGSGAHTITAAYGGGNYPPDSTATTVLVSPAPGSPGSGLTAGPLPSPTAPVRATISALSQTHPVFRVGLKSTPLLGRTTRSYPRGTTFSFRLDQPAVVALLIQRKLPGRRVGRVCKPPSRLLRFRPRCTRLVLKATLRRTARVGLNRIAFSGRIRGRALPAGFYRAAFTATNSVGTSVLRALSFRIVAP